MTKLEYLYNTVNNFAFIIFQVLCFFASITEVTFSFTLLISETV
jgi:hypothetical protein